MTSTIAAPIAWVDTTDRRFRPYASANRWTVTCGGKDYRVERTIHAYHVWDGNEWLGMYATTGEAEAAIVPAEATVPEPTNDADVVKAFEAKADEIAAANGWTIGRTRDLMLRYLCDTDPASAATVAAALRPDLA